MARDTPQCRAASLTVPPGTEIAATYFCGLPSRLRADAETSRFFIDARSPQIWPHLESILVAVSVWLKARRVEVHTLVAHAPSLEGIDTTALYHRVPFSIERLGSVQQTRELSR